MLLKVYETLRPFLLFVLLLLPQQEVTCMLPL